MDATNLLPDMVSPAFIHYLIRGHKPTLLSAPLALATSIAVEHGFDSFERAMAAVERSELSAEQELSFVEAMRPLVLWALEQQRDRDNERSADQVDAISALIKLIFRFLFGYSRDELEQLQREWAIDELVDRVKRAELQRSVHAAATKSSDPEAPARAMHSTFPSS